MQEPDLTAAERSEIRRSTLRVLENPVTAALFGPGSQAEVLIAGQVDDQWIEGRIDRLMIRPDTILLCDIKTNRPGAASLADVSPDMLRQLGLYARLLQTAYPAHAIEPVLIWTDGPNLMPIPLPICLAALNLGEKEILYEHIEGI